MSTYTDAEQQDNVRKVIGTEVTLRAYLGSSRPRTARIKGYVPPCVWELDRELGNPGNSFQPDSEVCLLNGKSVRSLIPDQPQRHPAAGPVAGEPTYYSVGRNGAWTTEPAPASFFTDRRATLMPSRIHPEESGIMTLWLDGHNVGTLFPSQEQQIEHLTKLGLITTPRASTGFPTIAGHFLKNAVTNCYFNGTNFSAKSAEEAKMLPGADAAEVARIAGLTWEKTFVLVPVTTSGTLLPAVNPFLNDQPLPQPTGPRPGQVR